MAAFGLFLHVILLDVYVHRLWRKHTLSQRALLLFYRWVCVFVCCRCLPSCRESRSRKRCSAHYSRPSVTLRGTRRNRWWAALIRSLVPRCQLCLDLRYHTVCKSTSVCLFDNRLPLAYTELQFTGAARRCRGFVVCDVMKPRQKCLDMCALKKPHPITGNWHS